MGLRPAQGETFLTCSRSADSLLFEDFGRAGEDLYVRLRGIEDDGCREYSGLWMRLRMEFGACFVWAIPSQALNYGPRDRAHFHHMRHISFTHPLRPPLHVPLLPHPATPALVQDRLKRAHLSEPTDLQYSFTSQVLRKGG